MFLRVKFIRLAESKCGRCVYTVAHEVERSNKLLGENQFGFLSCDNTSLILQDDKVSFSNCISSSLTIFSSLHQSEVLRQNLFFPLLIRHHFVLIWCKNDEIKLINSLEQDNRLLIQRIQTNLAKYLKSLTVIESGFAFKKLKIVVQKDLSSCGVCVCIAADAISLNKIDEATDVDIRRFRHWLIYALYTCAIEKSSKLTSVLNNCLRTVKQKPSIKIILKRKEQQKMPIDTVQTRTEIVFEKPRANLVLDDRAKAQWAKISDRQLKEILEKIVWWQICP